jgi:hypothetical protein
VKLLISLIALALFADCGTYSSAPSAAYSRPYPLRGSPSSSEPSVGIPDGYFAEQLAHDAAEQAARDQAQMDQNNRDVELQQTIQAAIYNDRVVHGDDR